MKNFPSMIAKLLCLLVLIGVTLPSMAQEDDAIARVIIVSGSVQVERNGETIDLARRSSIFVGDKIITAPDGSLQVRFVDNAILSLSCESELLIEDYQYLDRNNDRSELRLLRGQARTVTGVIQRRNTLFRTDRVEVRPAGTDYEVRVTDKAEYYGVYDGNIRISSTRGEIEIGNLAQAQYAVFEQDGEPARVPLRPAQLGTGALGGTNCE